MIPLNPYLLNETMDADQGGSDFVDSLPTPEIKTTEDLIAAATPAADAPKPTDAMLRGKEMSQIQFEGMEPVYEPDRRGEKGALLGYKFGMNQIQEPGMVASYSAPIYKDTRGGSFLVDPGGKLLGYDYTGPVELPKSDEILALEKRFGTTMDPVYATRAVEGRGGDRQVDYGPPIGYRFDNGKSQYVSFDATGKYTGTQNREKPGAFGNVLMSVLSVAFPPIAPFVQLYNAVKAIDEGNVLGFVISAVGAGKSIPGLDKSTISMLNDVATGAKIVQAVESKDPLKIFSSVVNLPNVDPDLKDLGIIINTAKALNDGNISGAFNGILKMSDRDSIGRLTDRFNDIVDGQDVAALNPPPDASTDEQIAKDQADREQAGREAARSSDKTIEQTLTDSGLVSANDQLAAKEQADREQAARDAARVSEKTIEQTLVDSGLVSDTNAQEQLAKEQADREQAARDAARISEKTIEDARIAQEQLAKEQENREQAGREAIRAQEQAAQLAQEQADREQVARDAIKIQEKTIEDQLTDAGLVSKTDDEKKLDSVDVTGKAIPNTDLPITDDEGRNKVPDSSVPVDPNAVTPTLAPVTVTGKTRTDIDLPITDDKVSNTVTDPNVPVNPNVGTTNPTLAPVTVTGKSKIDTDLPITEDKGRNTVTDSGLPVDPNVGTTNPELNKVEVTGKREVVPELDPVTITGKREVVQELDPVTVTGKREVVQELEPKTIVGKKEEPALPKLPTTTPAKTTTTPAKTTTAKTATPAEQLYQTITQGQPTTLADIKYYLDMASGGAVPPQNQHDPLESLLNQPMSVEELLHYLRS